MRTSRHNYRACQVSKNTIEVFQNISINEKRDVWFVRKLGFKGFEGRPWRELLSLKLSSVGFVLVATVCQYEEN